MTESGELLSIRRRETKRRGAEQRLELQLEVPPFTARLARKTIA